MLKVNDKNMCVILELVNTAMDELLSKLAKAEDKILDLEADLIEMEREKDGLQGTIDDLKADRRSGYTDGVY